MKKDMEADKRVRFKNLSWPLRIAVGYTMATLIYYVIIFCLGFAIGFAEAL